MYAMFAQQRSCRLSLLGLSACCKCTQSCCITLAKAIYVLQGERAMHSNRLLTLNEGFARPAGPQLPNVCEHCSGEILCSADSFRVHAVLQSPRSVLNGT